MRQRIITFIICILVAIGIKIAYSYDNIVDREPFYNVDPELEIYLDRFVDLAKLRGIDVSDIYNHDIVIKFTDYDNKNHVATAYRRDKDGIFIIVHKDRFMNRTEEGRKYVMWHEFGHDILNFKHLEHPNRGMMEPTAYTGFFKNYERFDKKTQEKYLYTSLNKMFERYNER